MSFWRVWQTGPCSRVTGQMRLRRVHALLRDERGVSAIEFGLIAPLLFFSLLAMTDVGFALNERIKLDHVLRAGAQPAMRDAGRAAVLTALRETACQSFTVVEAGCQSGDKLTVDVLDAVPICKCPGQADDPNCTSTCPVEPTKFYRIWAAMTYQPMFLPDMEALDFQPSVLVQVR